MDSEKPPFNKLAHNDQTKLTATYMNGVSLAALAVGGFAPLA